MEKLGLGLKRHAKLLSCIFVGAFAFFYFLFAIGSIVSATGGVSPLGAEVMSIIVQMLIIVGFSVALIVSIVTNKDLLVKIFGYTLGVICIFMFVVQSLSFMGSLGMLYSLMTFSILMLFSAIFALILLVISVVSDVKKSILVEKAYTIFGLVTIIFAGFVFLLSFILILVEMVGIIGQVWFMLMLVFAIPCMVPAFFFVYTHLNYEATPVEDETSKIEEVIAQTVEEKPSEIEVEVTPNKEESVIEEIEVPENDNLKEE